LRFAYPVHVAPATWVRGDAYYDAGNIVLENPVEYEIDNYEGVLDAFLDVEDPADAVAFATQWGLLQHGPDAKRYREPFADWKAEVTFVSIVAHIYMALQKAVDGDEDGLEALWETWGPQFLWGQFGIEGHSDKPSNDTELLEQASIVITLWMGDKLRDVEMYVAPAPMVTDSEDMGSFMLVTYLDTPLQMIWHEFMTLVTDHTEMRYCPVCGRPFMVKNARQVYCSPKCSGRVRTQRFRDARKAQSVDVN